MAMGPHGVVAGQQLLPHREIETRSVASVVVSVLDVDLGFVQGDPVDDPVSEATADQIRVLAHPGGAVTGDPATLREEGRGHVPVEQGRPGRDPGFEKGIDQSVVEVEAFLVHPTRAFGQDPRPCDRESIGVKPQRPHDLDVVLEPVIVIAGHRTAVSVFDGAFTIAEVVPDASTASAFEGRTFDLIRGGGGTPEKAFRKHRHGSNSSIHER
jgi:hypothetical protein